MVVYPTYDGSKKHPNSITVTSIDPNRGLLFDLEFAHLETPNLNLIIDLHGKNNTWNLQERMVFGR